MVFAVAFLRLQGRTRRALVSRSGLDADECKLVKSNLAGRTGWLDEEDHKHSIAAPSDRPGPSPPGQLQLALAA